MKKIVYLLLILVFVATTGCATILKGTSQTVTFNSEPSEADVIIDGKTMGKTPVSVSLKKKKVNNMSIRVISGNKRFCHSISFSISSFSFVVEFFI